MCSVILASVLNDLESGAFPQPVFFAWDHCRQGRWPSTRESLTLDMYGTTIPRTRICNSQSKALCPTPMWLSMVLPPNIRVTFESYTNNNDPEILSRVLEPGFTKIYGSDYSTTNFLEDVSTTSQLTWFSHASNGEPKKANGGTDNCATPVTSNSYYTPLENNTDPTKCNDTHPYNCKMMQSTISCQSPLWPSFFPVSAQSYRVNSPDSLWTGCVRLQRIPADDVPGTDNYCVQFGVGNIEETVIATAWSNPGAACNVQPWTSHSGFFNACGCLANLSEARSNQNPTHFNNITPSSCGTRNCGMCTMLFVPNPTPVDRSCACTDDTFTVQGSVQSIVIDFVDDNKNVITWPQLQLLWCSKGLSLAGVKVELYTSGTPYCDSIMRTGCLNTADLTLNPDLQIACQCIIEEKKLKEQFAGIDLPSQCFSAACNDSTPGVYKTREQLSGCSARLCQQVLTVNGTAMLAQGFQEVVCNATLYNVAALQPAGDVPLVSQVPTSSYGGFELGPPFYVAVGVFAVMLVLIIVYVIQTIRASRRSKQLKNEAATQEALERALR